MTIQKVLNWTAGISFAVAFFTLIYLYVFGQLLHQDVSSFDDKNLFSPMNIVFVGAGLGTVALVARAVIEFWPRR